MRKKIPVSELRKGMYVAELDRPWIGTSFLFQGFEITGEDVIAELRRCCQFVFIDTELEAAAGTAARKPVSQTPSTTRRLSEQDPLASLEFKLLKKTAPSAHAEHRYRDEIPLQDEMGNARKVESRSRELIYTIMDDVRLGRSLPTVEAKKVVAELVESVVRNPDALVWLTQLKNQDEYTALHSIRVCILALTFGRHLELPPEHLNVLGIGALLHDIGKLKIPDAILNKPARLTDAEYTIMKTHVPLGVALLENSPGIPAAAIEVTGRHHERYSGQGYISGYSGDNIGLFGMMGAIVDCYDAVTSDRSYQAGISAYDALALLYKGRNSDFHTGLVEQFIQCMGIYPIGSIVEMSSGSVGVVVSINRARRLKPMVALVLNADKQPYAPATVVDLFSSPLDGAGRPLEIKRILPAGTFDINPSAYLPVAR
jgi:HD-GYP domain-containing protein (c-di-GMP phosphodiesterase class II)